MLDYDKSTTMNPWAVNNLKDFLYYCCPECNEKEKSLESFLRHALNHHEKAKQILPNIIVKEEFNEDDENDDDNYSQYYSRETDTSDNPTQKESHNKKSRKRKPKLKIKRDDEVVVDHDNNEFEIEPPSESFQNPTEFLDVKVKTEDDDDMNDVADDENNKLDLKSKQKWDDHIEKMLNRTSDSNEYKCDLCDSNKIYKNRDSLKSHIKNIHQWNQPRETCKQCGKTFKNAAFLDKHIKAVHEGLRPFKAGSIYNR